MDYKGISNAFIEVGDSFGNTPHSYVVSEDSTTIKHALQPKNKVLFDKMTELVKTALSGDSPLTAEEQLKTLQGYQNIIKHYQEKTSGVLNVFSFIKAYFSGQYKQVKEANSFVQEHLNLRLCCQEIVNLPQNIEEKLIQDKVSSIVTAFKQIEELKQKAIASSPGEKKIIKEATQALLFSPQTSLYLTNDFWKNLSTIQGHSTLFDFDKLYPGPVCLYNIVHEEIIDLKKELNTIQTNGEATVDHSLSEKIQIALNILLAIDKECYRKTTESIKQSVQEDIRSLFKDFVLSTEIKLSNGSLESLKKSSNLGSLRRLVNRDILAFGQTVQATSYTDSALEGKYRVHGRLVAVFNNKNLVPRYCDDAFASETDLKIYAHRIHKQLESTEGTPLSNEEREALRSILQLELQLENKGGDRAAIKQEGYRIKQELKQQFPGERRFEEKAKAGFAYLDALKKYFGGSWSR